MENNTNFQTFHQMGAAINDFVKQATGRDNVQNINIDHITVAQNHYYEYVDVSGSVVSFHAGAAGLPLEKCVVQIEPVQDLHGYDYPWPGGGGKNLLYLSSSYATQGTVTYSPNPATGELILGGSAPTSQANRNLAEVNVVAGEKYFISGTPTNGSPSTSCVRYVFRDSRGGTAIGSITDTDSNGIIATAPEGATIISIYTHTTEGSNPNGIILKPFVAKSEVALPFEPYENICPITGWTGANVYVSPTTGAADGQTYTIAFPSEARTVYGGTLDVVSGKLVVDRMNIASYNGETLPGKWISDRDVYVEGATPTTGAQVVYELAEPITYQLTPTEITTLLGVNNIWADTGDIEVKFTDLKELY